MATLTTVIWTSVFLKPFAFNLSFSVIGYSDFYYFQMPVISRWFLFLFPRQCKGLLEWHLSPSRAVPVPALGLVSPKIANIFGPAKSFLVNLILKSEGCIRLELLVWREPQYILSHYFDFYSLGILKVSLLLLVIIIVYCCCCCCCFYYHYYILISWLCD